MTLSDVRFRTRCFLAALALLTAAGALGFHWLEGWSLGSALYFTIITVATVGYGDIYPVTTAGRTLAVVVIILGVGTFLGLVANVTELAMAGREQRRRRQTLNMIGGAFFGQVGHRLLAALARHDAGAAALGAALRVADSWTEADWRQAAACAAAHPAEVALPPEQWVALKSFLAGERSFLAGLFTNPALLEHERFTDLLSAVCHLEDELAYRPGFAALPASDLAHLQADARRVYRLLLAQWLDHLRYLRDQYPYLFSLARRTNPFDPAASPIVPPAKGCAGRAAAVPPRSKAAAQG